jgi:acyl-coenzyme A thioesterase PaaI-like protein
MSLDERKRTTIFGRHTTILSLGRRAATAEAKVTTTAGKLVAHATTTCTIFSLGE